MKAKDFRTPAFLAFFCVFQFLIVYWAVLDPGFIPDLAQAQQLLENGDTKAALRHFELLAKAGSPAAHWVLGEMYTKGEGVGQNMTKGVAHLEKAAQGNVVQAQFLLARLYSNGEGVPKDLIRAHVWLSLAALRERDTGEILLRLLENRMTPEQIEESWVQAERLSPGARARFSK